jgi:hypothetical protein
MDNLYKVAELLCLWAKYKDTNVGRFNKEDLGDNIGYRVGLVNTKKRKLNKGIGLGHA